MSVLEIIEGLRKAAGNNPYGMEFYFSIINGCIYVDAVRDNITVSKIVYPSEFNDIRRQFRTGFVQCEMYVALLEAMSKAVRASS